MGAQNAAESLIQKMGTRVVGLNCTAFIYVYACHKLGGRILREFVYFMD
jgi:hypothetical protein